MCTRLYIPESCLPELEAALSCEKDAHRARWLLGLRLMALKISPSVIGPELGVSERTVRNWAHRYLDAGIENTRPLHGGGYPQHLPHEEEERFKERIRQGPTKTDGFAVWRGVSIVEMLKTDFGVSYSLSGVYALLHRMGFSSLMPRPKSPKASEEEQMNFKKNASFGI